MTAPAAFQLLASVHYTWGGGTEYWEFELPLDGEAGRMRSASERDWRPWFALDWAQTERLRLLCMDTLTQPNPGRERPSLLVDGSSMKLRLQGPGDGRPVEDSIALDASLNSRETPPTSPLLRLVAAIYWGEWPDRAQVRWDRQPIPSPSFSPPDPEFAGMRPPEWPGVSPTGSVILPLPEARWRAPAERLELDGLPFVPKKELHLTLLSSGEAKELVAHLPEEAWRDAFAALHWTLAPSGSAVLLHENKPAGLEYSVVTPVDCQTLNAFRQRLSEASGAYLSPTVPHVTLWTRPLGRGIGISSTEQYREFFARELAPQEAAGFLEGTVFDSTPQTDTI